MAIAEEEPEPQLKYELLGGDVKDILSKERITCITLSEKIVALGTEQGWVHVLDYSGNQVRQMHVHKSRVNDLCFDKEAEHIATASQDCSVVVTNLYTDQVTRHEFKGPVKAVTLDPRPPTSRRTWRDLVTGTASGHITLHTQGWLARSDQPLAVSSSRDAAAGGVLALKWSGPLVAWAFDSVVSVYDTTNQQLIRTLRRHDPRADAAVGSTAAATAASTAAGAAIGGAGPAAAGRGPAATAGGAAIGGIGALRRCSLLFAPDSHLYVAWSDTILVAHIGSYENNVGSPAPQVELVARMKLGEAVLGVSPYGDDDLAVLVYPSSAPATQQTAQTDAPSRSESKRGSGTGSTGPEGAAGSDGAAARAAPGQSTAGSSPSAGAPSGASDGGGGGADGAGTAGSGAATAGETSPPPQPSQSPPDPLAPGRTPQLVILGRSDHREWARDAVPLPGVDRCGPADYLGLLPSLPHHLHLPPPPAAATSTTLAAAAAAKPPAAAAATTAALQPPAKPPADAPAAASSAGGSGGASLAETPGPSSSSAGGAGTVGGGGAAAAATPGSELQASAAPRRLVPVWVDGQELMFFIAAPMAIATARSREPSDRLGWLLTRRRWEEALSAVEEAPQGSLPPGTYDSVVDGYIEELLTRQSYDLAVELSERLLKGDAKRWERLVYMFAQARQLPKLAPRLPTDKPRLRPQVYDMALQSLLPHPADHPTLVALAQRWPQGSYGMAGLADAVAGRLRRMQHQHHQEQQQGQQGQGGKKAEAGEKLKRLGQLEGGGDALWQLLAWLYEQQGRPDLALSIHLRLRSPSVFSFVSLHGLQANLLGRAPDLLLVDERAALALLTAHADALPPSNVVPSIQEAMRTAPTPAEAEDWRRRLFAYLRGLFAVDSSVGADYQDLQVSLTAEYQPTKLMDLLVTSQYYSLESALSICEARGLVPEQVFVLGRMGNTDQALRLIIDRLGDIPRAIDFVVGQRDDELWGRLIDWALHSPETTGALLDCIGGYVDPLLLVRRIPRGMRVERLRDRLRAIIADYRTQTSLREGCNAILRSDCRHLLAKLYDGTRRALPYVFVHVPGTGGDAAGQWHRCDVVHGGRLQQVSPGDVPWEASSAQLGLETDPSWASVRPGPGPGLPSSHPDLPFSSAAATAARVVGASRPPPAVVGGGGSGGGLTRTHGSSAPSLAVAAAGQSLQPPLSSAYGLGQGGGGGRASGGGGGGDDASVTENLPWWATGGDGHDGRQQTHGSAVSSSPPSLWVGFNLAAGRARLGGEDPGPPGAWSGGSHRRAASAAGTGGGGGPGGRRGPGAAGPAGAGGGGGSGHGPTLGSLWQHVVARA